MVIPEKWEKIDASPTIAPITAMGVSRPQSRKVELRQSLVFSPSWGARAEGPGRPKQLKFIGQSARWKSGTERERKRAARSSLQVSIREWSMHTCDKTHPKPGKEPPKRTPGTSIWHSNGAGTVLFPQTRLGNLTTHRTLVRVLRKVLTLDYTQIRSPLTNLKCEVQ